MIDSVAEQGGASVDLKRSRRRKMPDIDPTKLDRLPPHSVEAEQAVKGKPIDIPLAEEAAE